MPWQVSKQGQSMYLCVCFFLDMLSTPTTAFHSWFADWVVASMHVVNKAFCEWLPFMLHFHEHSKPKKYKLHRFIIFPLLVCVSGRPCLTSGSACGGTTTRARWSPCSTRCSRMRVWWTWPCTPRAGPWRLTRSCCQRAARTSRWGCAAGHNAPWWTFWMWDWPPGLRVSSCIMLKYANITIFCRCQTPSLYMLQMLIFVDIPLLCG